LCALGYIASRPPDEQKKTAGVAYSPAGTPRDNADEDVNTVPGVARGLNVVPGAIVCPDYPTLKLMLDLYNESWAESSENMMTKGLYAAINGPPMPAPNFGLHGCALLPIGTPMRQRNVGSIVPGVLAVIATLPNGERITGLTFPMMISITPEGLRKQQDLQQEQEQRYAEIEQRYAEIMKPEIERHAAVVQQEEDRHMTVMRQLHPTYRNMFVQTDIDSVNPGQLVNEVCGFESNETNLTICRDEVARYISARQDEKQRHRSAQAAAREQAAHPKSD
jgi:hypothetical protein